MSHNDVISTLNELIETCKDGEQGFRTCSEDISDPQLKSLFAARSEGCAKAAAELQELVLALGGTPVSRGSMSGAIHRGWVDIKAAITGKDDESILAETERGEDIAVASYRQALEKELPPDIRALVERQYTLVLRNHDQVKELREQARAAKNLSR